MILSLKLEGLEKVPEDSTIYVTARPIYVNGNNIRRVLFGIDAGVPEHSLAKQLAYDAVIAHYPQGGIANVNFHEIFRRHAQQMTNAGISLKGRKMSLEKNLKS